MLELATFMALNIITQYYLKIHLLEDFPQLLVDLLQIKIQFLSILEFKHNMKLAF